MAAQTPDWLIHFRLLIFIRRKDFNKLVRKQDLTILYHVCLFWVDQIIKMAPRSLIGWYIFQIFLCSHWIDFNKTLQEPETPLSFVFCNRSLSACIQFQKKILRCTTMAFSKTYSYKMFSRVRPPDNPINTHVHHRYVKYYEQNARDYVHVIKQKKIHYPRLSCTYFVI